MAQRDVEAVGAEEIHEVLEAAPVGMIKVDSNGRVIFTNRELERMFRYSREQLRGAPLDVLIPDRYRVAHAEHLRRFSEMPQTRKMAVGRELFGRRSDGTEFPVDVALNPVVSGNQPFVVASVIDVTEQHESAKQLTQLAADLKERNEELERFVITVSHDLKSPLVTMLGYLGHLQRDLEAGRIEEQQEYVQRIRRAGERMKLKIDDLLSFSRVGRDGVEPSMVNIASVIQNLLDLKSEELEAKHIRVHMSCTTEALCCDPSHFERVIDNLLVNAMRYGCANPSPEVWIQVRQLPDQMVELIVADNGTGVDQKYAERVFELFQRLSSDGEGTGVGLAIVRKIANWYGGRAWVDERLGGGAQFHVTFSINRRVPVEEKAPGLPGQSSEIKPAQPQAATGTSGRSPGATL